MPTPIYMDKRIKFIIYGRPLVQKNNLQIIKVKRGGKLVSFIDHSSKMKSFRDKVSMEMYKQYTNQGYTKPINFLNEVSFRFFVLKQSEPDLDNLPAIFLDAMQGFKVKKSNLKIAITMLDDKLIRKLSCEKVVKGDPKYDGQERCEIEIRRYERN